MRRRSHTAKGARERQDYANKIKKLGYNPTVDDSLNFRESDSPSQDLSVSTKNVTRRDPWEQRAKNHLTENWVKYFAAILSFVIAAFMFQFNRSLGQVESAVSFMKDSINETKSQNEKLFDKQQNLELKIQENALNLKFIENMLNEEKPE